MTLHTVDPHNPESPSYRLGLEASCWLVRLQEELTENRDNGAVVERCTEEFLGWVTRAPAHLTMFLDTYEAYKKLAGIDAPQQVKIEALLRPRRAEVVHLYGRKPEFPHPHLRRLVIGIATVVTFASICGWISRSMFSDREFSTSIGEQRTVKLADGSFISLNTNSQVKVEIRNDRRQIELTRGEALFSVAHDPARPFIVLTGHSRVRATGTQFNVRERTGSTDVAVLEGSVQVSPAGADTAHSRYSGIPDEAPNELRATREAASAPATAEAISTRVAAGECATVSNGRVQRWVGTNVAQAVSWRKRRLIFQDTPLTEVASEFNRYNYRQIRVDPSVRLSITAVFDADRPNALILYTMKQPSLEVQSDGDNWAIRPSEPR